MRLPRPQTGRAFTLIECLVASAVLAVAVAAISQAIVAGQMSTYDALHSERAVGLAEALMEEILALPYADPDGASAPGPEAGENNRADFDNLDDFHGYSEAAGLLADAGGVLYGADFQAFSRAVTAAYGTVTVDAFGRTFNGLTVTITVTDANGRVWTLSRFVPEPIE